jgi:CubicO group peptidase (beta-lactamase class C family)
MLNKKTIMAKVVYAIMMAGLAIIITGCSGSKAKQPSQKPGPGSENNPPKACRGELEDQMTAILSNLVTDTDFSLYIEAEDGRSFTFSQGSSTLSTSYAAASTSKWVTAVIILRLVDQGLLSLSDHPQDYILNWNIPPSDTLYNITLSDLLSLTSGLINTPDCLNSSDADFETCVRQIATINVDNGKIPGAEFNYGPSHLQIAGLMAIKAAGVDSWQALFEQFKLETGLFTNSFFDTPSISNPRLDGGMHWQANDYIDFIRAFQFGDLLTLKTRGQMLMDRTASSEIVNSPIEDSLSDQWHYGYGIWLQCPHTAFDCETIAYYSSPGIYGAYPFMNAEQHFFGIVARQGANETIAEGKAVYDAVTGPAEEWAGAPIVCQ